MTEIEKKIGYEFKNRNLLEIAITHSSYANEKNNKISSYERFEFLGDSVLSIITSEYIFKNFPELPEGELTKLRSALVCEKTLCKFSQKMNFQKYVKLSRGEKRNGGENRASILADMFESVLAAIYFDGGMEQAKKYVLRFIIPSANNPGISDVRDYKTDLQEIVQKNDESVKYVLVKESGPDHNKRFTVEVRLSNNVLGIGVAKSKKEAEQQAAREALKLMGV